MAIPLLAAAAAKTAAATAAKAVAAGAAKAGAATAAKVGTGAAKAAATKAAGAGAKSKLSIGMLQDPKVNLYPGSKNKTFAKKAGKYLESAGGQDKEMKWRKPTEADISSSGGQPNNPDATYSKQIDKLESMRK